MGEYIKTGSNGEIEVWSTYTERRTHNFEDKKLFLEYIKNEEIYKGKLKAVEKVMSYPYGRSVDGERSTENLEGMQEYYDWLLSLNRVEIDTYEKYYGEIDKKLKSL